MGTASQTSLATLDLPSRCFQRSSTKKSPLPTLTSSTSSSPPSLPTRPPTCRSQSKVHSSQSTTDTKQATTSSAPDCHLIARLPGKRQEMLLRLTLVLERKMGDRIFGGKGVSKRKPKKKAFALL